MTAPVLPEPTDAWEKRQSRIEQRVVQVLSVPGPIFGPPAPAPCLCGVPFWAHNAQMLRECRRNIAAGP